MMAMLRIVQGDRPPRPTHPTFTEGLWSLTQRCWGEDPQLRPEASEVLQVLLSPSSDVDRIVEADGDDRLNETTNLGTSRLV